MARRQSKAKPTWASVKATLASFDRTALLNLVQNLYVAHKENQAFLHARLGLGEDLLGPYKRTINRWLWPHIFRRQQTSVRKAKQAISDYKKAINDPEGLSELMVFYCEQAVGFSKDVGHDDADYFEAQVRMFEQAVRTTNVLARNTRSGLLARLDRVWNMSYDLGYATKAKSVGLTEEGAKRSKICLRSTL